MEKPDPKLVTFIGVATVTVEVHTETREEIGRLGKFLVGDWSEDFDWELQGHRFNTSIKITMDPVPNKIEDV